MVRTVERDSGLSPNVQPGIGIDAAGGGVVDPTKNVEALVRALELTLDKLRTADTRRSDDLRLANDRRQDDLRDADNKRLLELATQKDRYDRQIFDIQTVQVKTTSDLISAQLSKETGSLSNQINAATVQTQGLILTLSGRIDKLEQARYEGAGRASVQDPATAAALTQMAHSIQTLTDSKNTISGKSEGSGGVWLIIFAVLAALSSISAIVAVIVTLAKHG